MTTVRRACGRRAVAGVLLAGVLAGGCRAGHEVSPVAAARGPGEPDVLFGQVDATLGVAIELGRLASVKASDPELRAFAADQVAHYAALRTDLRATAYDLDLQPAQVSLIAAAAGERPIDALRLPPGPRFDRAYVRQALAIHQRLLPELDAALRRVRDRDLRRALHELRGTMPDAEAAPRAADGDALQSFMPR